MDTYFIIVFLRTNDSRMMFSWFGSKIIMWAVIFLVFLRLLEVNEKASPAYKHAMIMDITL